MEQALLKECRDQPSLLSLCFLPPEARSRSVVGLHHVRRDATPRPHPVPLCSRRTHYILHTLACALLTCVRRGVLGEDTCVDASRQQRPICEVITAQIGVCCRDASMSQSRTAGVKGREGKGVPGANRNGNPIRIGRSNSGASTGQARTRTRTRLDHSGAIKKK